MGPAQQQGSSGKLQVSTLILNCRPRAMQAGTWQGTYPGRYLGILAGYGYPVSLCAAGWAC